MSLVLNSEQKWELNLIWPTILNFEIGTEIRKVVKQLETVGIV